MRLEGFLQVCARPIRGQSQSSGGERKGRETHGRQNVAESGGSPEFHPNLSILSRARRPHPHLSGVADAGGPFPRKPTRSRPSRRRGARGSREFGGKPLLRERTVDSRRPPAATAPFRNGWLSFANNAPVVPHRPAGRRQLSTPNNTWA
jgi:hypothetical protein